MLFHPSQDVTPSREDIEVTHRLVECDRQRQCRLLQHERKRASLTK
ncbi:JAB domain-containing protein [Rossellomorea marisflavi]